MSKNVELSILEADCDEERAHDRIELGTVVAWMFFGAVDRVMDACRAVAATAAKVGRIFK